MVRHFMMINSNREYPVISVKTKDNLVLFGLLTEAKKSDTILINIHGTGSSFFAEEFEYVFHRELPKLGISTLFTNNRGNYGLESWQSTGSAIEIFEDSIVDIDCWIEYAISKGYEKIILQGHSFGTEKVVYYMNHGEYANDVSAVILLGFSDTVGTQLNFEKTIDVNLMIEAEEKHKKGRDRELLCTHPKPLAGEALISAQTYLNYFSPNSELSKTLPLRNNNTLPLLRNIKTPILAVIGDHGEYTVIPIGQAIELLEKENSLLEAHQIIGANHCYEGKQEELIKIVADFVKRKVIRS